MSFHSGLFESTLPLIVHPPTTGNGALTSPIIDMQGWNGLALMLMQGTNAGGTTVPMVVSNSSDSAMSGSTVIASGTLTPGTVINSFAAMEIWRPTGRYVRVVSTPGGTEVFGVAGIQYGRTGTLPAGTAAASTGGGTATAYTKIVAN